MKMSIAVGESERGFELMYRCGDGPWAFGPEEESAVYASRAEAQEAAEREVAESRAWNRRSAADAPHMDAF